MVPNNDSDLGPLTLGTGDSVQMIDDLGNVIHTFTDGDTVTEVEATHT